MLANSHRARLFTGICILILLGIALYFEGWIMLLLVLLTAVAGQYEFYNMFWKSKTQMLPEKIGGILCGAGLLFTSFIQANELSVLCIILACVLSAMSFLIRFGYGTDNASLPQSMLLLTGFAYIPLIIQLVFNLHALEVILILVAVSSSDAAAYYVGTAWGKRKICPRISPKKSILGCIAGFTACTTIVTILGILLLKGSCMHWMFMGIILSIMSQLGDFFESAIKRSIDVKDSGNILPGHGGILDRIDSFLFALPSYVLLSLLTSQ